MRYLLIGIVFCIGVGLSDALWCFKCSGTGCETPDTNVEGVYITECDDYTSLCYKQTLSTAAGSVISRGCSARKMDCANLCIDGGDYTICESCCDGNICNSARTIVYSLTSLVICVLIGLIL